MSRISDRQRLAAVILAGFSAFLGLYAPQPLLPMLRGVFGVSTSSISWIVTISNATVALTAPFVGIVSDRWGRRRVIALGALLISIPTGCAALSGSFAQLLFWRGVQGILTPSISATTVAYISEEWEGSTGTAITYYVAGTILGGFSGRMLSAQIASQFNWQISFAVLGFLSLLCGIAIWRWLPPDRYTHAGHKEAGQARVILAHLRNIRLLSTCAVGFCVLFTIIAAFTYIGFYLSAPPFYWTTSELGLLFCVYLVAAVTISAAAKSIDRFGYRAALIGAMTTAIAGILITLIHSPWAAVIGMAVCCSGIFMAQSAANSYIGVVTTEARAAAVGLYVTSYYTGGTFGAFIPGYLWNWGGWPGCVAVIVGVQVLSLCLAGVFWRSHKAGIVLPAEVSA